jgi:hypothetical protein
MHTRLLGTAAAVAAAGALIIFGASACSSDSSTEGKNGQQASGGGAANSGTTTADPDAGAWNTQYDVPHVDAGPIPPFTDFSTIPDPWAKGDVAACKAFGDGSYPVSRACMCDAPTCLELMRQCDALEGCIEIRDCAWRTGCSNANDCYLLKQAGDPNGCVDVIDKWGNTGDAVAIANTVGACGQALPTPCPLPGK